jgi:MFS family permease
MQHCLICSSWTVPHVDEQPRLLLTAPPYLVATVLALTISWSSDRRPERCYHLLAPIVFGMVGFIIAATTKATAPRYFSLFLMVGGLFGSYNVALAWISSTFPRPRAKRAAAYATINSLGNSGSNTRHRVAEEYCILIALSVAQIWSPYLYDSSFGPSYTVSSTQPRLFMSTVHLGPFQIAFVSNTIMSAVAVLFCLILRWCLARENRKMEREEAEQTEMSQEGASMRIRYVL